MNICSLSKDFFWDFSVHRNKTIQLRCRVMNRNEIKLPLVQQRKYLTVTLYKEILNKKIAILLNYEV